MTQLVELQRMIPVLDEQHVAAYSVSYDGTSVLVAFGEREGITFPMLSDIGSVVITRLGLKNDRVYEQHSVFGFKPDPKYEGVPYPGVFALDREGTVSSRRFFNLYRERETGPGLIERVFGIEAADGPQFEATVGNAGVTVRLDSADYKSHQRVWLYCDIDLDPGSHVFAAGTRHPYVPVAVEVDPADGLYVGDAEWPKGHTFSLAGAPDGLLVHEGSLRGAVPLRFFSNSGHGDLTVTGRVHLQVCTDTMCDVPGTIEFALPISEGRLVRPPPRAASW